MNTDIKFEEGEWVKEKNGTQGMTVIGYAGDEPDSEVRCKFKNAEGEEIEENFRAEDLVRL